MVIDDNDGFDPIMSITDVDGGSEPGSVGFTVTLTGPSDLPITVDWGISDSAAGPGDGYVAAGTLTIPAGETTATVSVPAGELPIGEDAIGDPDRVFSVTLSNPVNAVFSGGMDTIEAQLPVREHSMVEPSAPVVAAVPDTAGNLIVSWEPPEDAYRAATKCSTACAGRNTGGSGCRPALKRTSRFCSWRKTPSTRRGCGRSTKTPRTAGLARTPRGRSRATDALGRTSRAASPW